MEALGWDRCDVVLVTGDAYVDHPSFGMALIGRLLESRGFRVGILAQPDWRNLEDFAALGQPRLFFGITAGNMDSLVNHYTSDKKPRSDDAYTPGADAGARPDRAVLVYAQRCRELYRDTVQVIGGIEASLRRIAHYDYWSNKVRRSILVDSGADLLVYGNGERAVVALAERLAAGDAIESITDLRGTAFRCRGLPEGFTEVPSDTVDTPGPLAPSVDPYQATPSGPAASAVAESSLVPAERLKRPPRVPPPPRERTVLRLPAWDAVRDDPVLYAHASRVLHLETNPGNARCLVQRNGDHDVWVNPPPVPLTTEEMDHLYELPYTRRPHPRYEGRPIPAYEMIRFSVTIQRGCFGGCSFCSITEHEGRIIQSRSEESILREVATIRDQVPGFTGVISDLGGPTANMYRLACKSPAIESKCRRLSCVYPRICENLNTDHSHLVRLYRKARALPGIKKVLIASGVRYDLAVESPEYVRELVTHHVGGYLKIAPEHVAEGPLSKMMKPGVGSYERFRELFERFSREAGKKQYLIPYFIAAHPGTRDEDMLELALWLKQRGFKADQVQAFLPSPLASATTMYHSGKSPLRAVKRRSEEVYVPKSPEQRRLHKAFLRYHAAENWPLLRAALRRMGRADLIGNEPHQLIPAKQPPLYMLKGKSRPGTFRTQHTGVEAGRSRPGTPRPGTPQSAGPRNRKGPRR
jgi:uncharacterized radical SAM protein YgiQ